MLSLLVHFVRGLLITVVTLGWLCGANAEVGAITEGSEVKAVYVLKVIVDDPDPISGIWARYSSDGSNRHVLNDDGFVNGDGSPSVVQNEVTNLAIAAWAKNTASGYDVVVSQLTAGSWTTPVAVAGSSENELDPFLVVNPEGGSVHLFYWVNDEWPRVMYRQAPPDLSTWSSPVQVSSPAEVAVRPTAVFHQGTLHVVYESHGQTYGSAPRQIVLGTRTGSSFTTEVVAVTSHSDVNWPEVHSANDRLWVDWIDGASEMAWTRRQESGTWDPVQTEPYSTIEIRDFHVRGTIRGHVLE
jgi:hypothetical protein